jgi:hypothetical protein
MALSKGDMLASKNSGSFEIVDISPPDAKGDIIAYLRLVRAKPDTLVKS